VVSRRRDRPFVLRAAIGDDMSAIAAIYGHHVTHGTASFELEAPDAEEMRRRHAAIERAGYPYLVAVDLTQGVVGFACAGPYRARAAYRHTVENSVYVKAGEGGYGIGGALLAALVEACEARGFRQMIAIIGGGENAASIALHAAQGFVEVGRFRAVGRKFGRWLDTVMMQRALGEGATSPPYHA
jgi:phosphinothricin acetyltransferase